jgi:hypothetical protein
VVFRREGGALLVSVADGALGVAGEPPPVLAAARFEYDANARLRRYDGYGPMLEETRNAELHQQLSANAQWFDSDADVWLKERGGSSTFESAPPSVDAATRQVAEHLGMPWVPGRPQFVWYAESQSVEAARAFRGRPAWTAEVAWVGPDGLTETYRLEYEPFGGRLISVVRR